MNGPDAIAGSIFSDFKVIGTNIAIIGDNNNVNAKLEAITRENSNGEGV